MQQRHSAILAGLVASAITLAAGLSGIGTRSDRFHARAEVAITTKANAPRAAIAELTPVASAIATAYNTPASVMPLLGTRYADVGISAQLIAGTSTITIDAASPDPLRAEGAAFAIVSQRLDIGPIGRDYKTQVLAEPMGTAHRLGSSTNVLVMLTVCMAIVAGIIASVVWRRIPPASPTFSRRRAQRG